jgi:hypothetical protein
LLLKSDISGSDEMLFVNYVAFHPEITDVLLAGYGNGEIRFYHKDYSRCLKLRKHSRFI